MRAIYWYYFFNLSRIWVEFFVFIPILKNGPNIWLLLHTTREILIKFRIYTYSNHTNIILKSNQLRWEHIVIRFGSWVLVKNNNVLYLWESVLHNFGEMLIFFFLRKSVSQNKNKRKLLFKNYCRTNQNELRLRLRKHHFQSNYNF